MYLPFHLNDICRRIDHRLVPQCPICEEAPQKVTPANVLEEGFDGGRPRDERGTRRW